MNDAEYKYLRGLIEGWQRSSSYPLIWIRWRKLFSKLNPSTNANNLEIQFLKDWKKSRGKETTKEERQKIEKIWKISPRRCLA
ncbi:MAG: hypothetical protein IPK63_17760 [Candidatus Competibacteraceae bacterium]|nr:hypothetical protein [Candidatus Competibacteraceae bacterium]